MTRWFDAHLDIACIALEGRDLSIDDPAKSGSPNPPGAITFPSLARGNVRACLATVFTEPNGKNPAISYVSGDAVSASAAGRKQIDLYHRWAEEGRLDFFPPRSHLVQYAWNKRDPLPDSPLRAAVTPPLTIGILVEGADVIREPAELEWWVEQGVVQVGLAWARQTRYAGGNTCETGLTDLGRAMIAEIDRLGVVHDASHLSDASLRELFERTNKPVVASHSNCRGILDDGSLELGPRQRHLTDDSIREIGRRGGMIGSVIYSPFIIRGGKRERRASLEEWARHIDRTCELVGNRSQIGLGSDADGGFSALTLPQGIDQPSQYALFGETLAARGWTNAEIDGFAWGNWARFWGLS